jgi:trimethylamine-N-oxide reductase (cytochrome c), cytochrome c-type subunit TorY
VDEETRNHAQVLQIKQDDVTDSEWKEVNFAVQVTKEKMSSDLTALEQYGNQLNQTHCSGFADQSTIISLFSKTDSQLVCCS